MAPNTPGHSPGKRTYGPVRTQHAPNKESPVSKGSPYHYDQNLSPRDKDQGTTNRPIGYLSSINLRAPPTNTYNPAGIQDSPPLKLHRVEENARNQEIFGNKPKSSHKDTPNYLMKKNNVDAANKNQSSKKRLPVWSEEENKEKNKTTERTTQNKNQQEVPKNLHEANLMNERDYYANIDLLLRRGHEQDNKTIDEYIAHSKKLMKDIRKDNQNKKNHIEKLGKQIELLKEKLKCQNELLIKLKEERDRANEQNKNTENLIIENDRLHKEIRENFKLIQSYKSQEFDKTNQIKNLNELVENLNKQVEKLKADNGKYIESRDSLFSHIKALERNIQAQNEEIRSLKTELAGKNRRESALADYKHDLETKNNKINEITEKLKQRDSKIALLEIQVKDQDSILSLKQKDSLKLKEEQDMINEQSKKIDNLNKKNEFLQRENSEKEQRIQEYSRQRSDERDQVQELNRKLEKLTIENKNSMQSQNHLLSENQRLERNKEAQNEEINRLNTRIKGFTEEKRILNETTEENRKKDQMLNDLKGLLKTRESEIADSHNEIEQRNTDIAHLQEQVERLKSTLEIQGRDSSKLKEALDRAIQQNEQIDTLRKENEHLYELIEIERNSRENQHQELLFDKKIEVELPEDENPTIISLKAEIELLSEHSADLEIKNQKFESLIQDLRSNLRGKEKSVFELEEEHKFLKEKAETADLEYKKLIHVKEEVIRKLRENKDELMTLLDEKEMTIEEFKISETDLEKKINELAEKNIELEERFEDFEIPNEEEINRLNKIIQEKQTEIEEKTNGIEILYKEKADHLETIEKLNKELKGKENEIDTLYREKVEDSETIHKLDEENDKLKLDQAELDVKVIQNEMRKLKKSFKASKKTESEDIFRLNQTIYQREDELREKTDEIERLSKQIEGIRIDSAQSEEVNKQLKEELAELNVIFTQVEINRLNESLKQSQNIDVEEIASLKHLMQKTEQELKQKTKEIEMLYEEKTEDNENLQKLDEENDELKRKVADQSVILTQKQIKSLEKSLKAPQVSGEDHVAFKARFSELEKQLESKNSEIQSLRSERNEESENIQRLDRENDELKRRISEQMVTSRQSRNQRQEKTLKNERESMTKTIDELKKKNQELSSRNSQQSEVKVKELQDLINQLKIDNTRLLEKIQESKDIENKYMNLIQESIDGRTNLDQNMRLYWEQRYEDLMQQYNLLGEEMAFVHKENTDLKKQSIDQINRAILNLISE